jgi:DNA mismatch repair protein MutL
VSTQEGDELIILDQHGAHERILYERLLKNPKSMPVEPPDPLVVRLPEDLVLEAWNFESELGSLGFEFEPFGEGALRVSKVPDTVADPEAALLAALGALVGARTWRRRSPARTLPGSGRASPGRRWKLC